MAQFRIASMRIVSCYEDRTGDLGRSRKPCRQTQRLEALALTREEREKLARGVCAKRLKSLYLSIFAALWKYSSLIIANWNMNSLHHGSWGYISEDWW